MLMIKTMLMNATFLFVAFGCGAAAKPPSLEELASANRWEKIREEVIVTASRETTTFGAYVRQVLAAPKVDAANRAHAYDSFVLAYRKRAQKYTALICAYACQMLCEESEGNGGKAHTPDVLSKVEGSLAAFDTRFRMFADADLFNEFQSSGTDLTMVRKGDAAQVCEFLAKTKDTFHRIVAKHCVPNGGDNDLSPVPPAKQTEKSAGKPARSKKIGRLERIGSMRKPQKLYTSRFKKNMHRLHRYLRRRKAKETIANSAALDSDKGQTVPANACRPDGEKVATIVDHKHSVEPSKPDSSSGEATDNSSSAEYVSAESLPKFQSLEFIGNRCDLSDMYGSVADKSVWDIFLDNSEKSFEDLKRILDELEMNYLSDEKMYTGALNLN